MKTAVEWLVEQLELDMYQDLDDNTIKIIDQAKEMEKDQLGALYLTLLLNTPDITKFDFEEWYNQKTNK